MSEGPRVLVVEDDEDDFFFTQRALRRYTSGEITHVQNGKAAVEYLLGKGAFQDRAKHPLPEIVFLDLKMNGGTGHEVLAALRVAPPNPLPRIYVLTGSNEPKDRELVKNSGVAAGYIVKPLSPEYLNAIFAPVHTGQKAGETFL
jgi:CheY-like chemotaxis protein